MNRKLQIAYIFSAFAVLSYLSLKKIPMPVENTQSVMADIGEDTLLIVQCDEDGLLVPLNVELELPSTIEEKLKKMTELMSSDTDASCFAPVLPADSELQKVTIDQGHAVLDFNEAFLDYDLDQELPMLEALVWGATQFDEIDTVAFSVNGELLTKMPKKGTPLTYPLDRSLGINNFELSSSTLHDSQNLNIYYVKEINGSQYFIPKSKRVSKQDLDVNDVVQEILTNISATSTLSQPLALEGVILPEPVTMDMDTIIINLNNSILSEETVGKHEALNTMALT